MEQENKRSYFIDNLRIICILLLFPFHAAMCFNNFGEAFYVWIEADELLSQIIIAVYPWWMALLFVLAGISTQYALKRRSAARYAKERVLKLLIPLVFGLLLIIPPQSYIGDVFNNGYSGGYFTHYGKFFSQLTDFSGNDGCFTPGHLWFILYLFVISIVFLPLTAWYSKREKKPDFSKINILLLAVGGFLIVGLLSFVADIGGKSVGDFASCFLLGFFILSDKNVLGKLKKHCVPLGIAWALLIAARCTMWAADFQGDVVWYLEYKALEWVGILAALGLGAHFLDFRGKFTAYFAPAAFPLYYLHQTILVGTAFLLSSVTKDTVLVFTLTTLGSFAMTVGAYEIFRRIRLTRFMFGIKK